MVALRPPLPLLAATAAAICWCTTSSKWHVMIREWTPVAEEAERCSRACLQAQELARNGRARRRLPPPPLTWHACTCPPHEPRHTCVSLVSRTSSSRPRCDRPPRVPSLLPSALRCPPAPRPPLRRPASAQQREPPPSPACTAAPTASRHADCRCPRRQAGRRCRALQPALQVSHAYPPIHSSSGCRRPPQAILRPQGSPPARSCGRGGWEVAAGGGAPPPAAAPTSPRPPPPAEEAAGPGALRLCAALPLAPTAPRAAGWSAAPAAWPRWRAACWWRRRVGGPPARADVTAACACCLRQIGIGPALPFLLSSGLPALPQLAAAAAAASQPAAAAQPCLVPLPSLCWAQGAMAGNFTYDELQAKSYLEVKGTTIANQCPILGWVLGRAGAALAGWGSQPGSAGEPGPGPRPRAPPCCAPSCSGLGQLPSRRTLALNWVQSQERSLRVLVPQTAHVTRPTAPPRPAPAGVQR